MKIELFWNLKVSVLLKVNVKVKLSLYMPGLVLRAPED